VRRRTCSVVFSSASYVPRYKHAVGARGTVTCGGGDETRRVRAAGAMKLLFFRRVVALLARFSRRSTTAEPRFPGDNDSTYSSDDDRGPPLDTSNELNGLTFNVVQLDTKQDVLETLFPGSQDLLDRTEKTREKQPQTIQ